MTSDMDWLTSDEDERQRFLDDPMSHFAYTVQGYRDIIHMIQEVNTEKNNHEYSFVFINIYWYW